MAAEIPRNSAMTSIPKILIAPDSMFGCFDAGIPTLTIDLPESNVDSDTLKPERDTEGRGEHFTIRFYSQRANQSHIQDN